MLTLVRNLWSLFCSYLDIKWSGFPRFHPNSYSLWAGTFTYWKYPPGVFVADPSLLSANCCCENGCCFWKSPWGKALTARAAKQVFRFNKNNSKSIRDEFVTGSLLSIFTLLKMFRFSFVPNFNTKYVQISFCMASS